jgi:hypothetical protein
MGTKTMKMNDEKTNLSLNPNIKTKNLQKHEMCKQKCKKIVILIKYEFVNTKGTKQGYGTRSYLKLLLNKLKIIRGPTSIYTLF